MFIFAINKIKRFYNITCIYVANMQMQIFFTLSCPGENFLEIIETILNKKNKIASCYPYYFDSIPWKLKFWWSISAIFFVGNFLSIIVQMCGTSLNIRTFNIPFFSYNTMLFTFMQNWIINFTSKADFLLFSE